MGKEIKQNMRTIIIIGSMVFLLAPVLAQVQAQPPGESPWRLSTSKNELTGIETITASTGESPRLVFRQTGNHEELYLATDEVLDDLVRSGPDSILQESDFAPVSYRFDDGPIVRNDLWSISGDHTALFAGNLTKILRTLSASNKLVIEYKPLDRIAKTATFDVSKFPFKEAPKPKVKARREKKP